MFPGDAKYSVDLVTTEADLLSLRSDWNRLSEAAVPNMFTTFEWYHAWVRQFAHEPDGPCDPAVFVARQDGAVTGVLPLIRRTASRGGLHVRKLEFVHPSAAYNDGLFPTEAAAQLRVIFRQARRLGDHFDMLDLVNLRCATGTPGEVARALQESSFGYRAFPVRQCKHLAIDGNWSGILEGYSKATRDKLRQVQNRLNRLTSQGLQIRIFDRPHTESGLLSKMRSLEQRRCVSDRPLPLFVDRYPEALQRLIDTLGPRDALYFGMIELDGEPVSCELGFRCANKLWSFSKTYDRTFFRCSPGTILSSNIIDYGFLNGYVEYDFLIGEEDYKLKWSTGANEMVRIAAWPDSWSARRKAFMYFDVKPLLYRIAPFTAPRSATVSQF